MDGMNNVAGDGGSPQDRGMEARLAVLEEIAAATRQSVADQRADTNRRFEEVNRRFEEVNHRFDAVDRRFDSMRDAMERDFRLLFGAIITVALGLAALMAKGFHWF
jgi:tetrahydromethanopterin S-methyltransferase subunit G